MKITFLMLLSILGFSAVCGAAEPSSPVGRERPKVGLVLGGGGARGAAHVGVIRVLEEQNIKVDYVAGTSMGAIVGALYALGLTADEIEAELLAVDWADLFADRTSRLQRSMRRKEDDTASFIPIEFGLRDFNLRLPRGYIAGQKFPFAFDIPGLVAVGHRSFDDLPIPFRAVATDLETGDKVVLAGGNLIRAVRASMSIPGVFPPVEIDGRLLVDGFLSSDLPVDVVREMGADAVIAVNVERRVDAGDRDRLRTIDGITDQMFRIRTDRSIRNEIARADVVIRPEVDEWMGHEYDRLARIIPRGEIAAREATPELAGLAVDEVAYDDWRRRIASAGVAAVAVDRIELDNRTRIDDRVLWHQIDIPVGAPLDLDLLKDDLEEIFELGLVETVDFDLDARSGENVLTVIAHEKPYAPNIVRFGACYSLSYDGASDFLLHARINKREINRLGGEWRTDLSLGMVSGIATGFHQPLDYGRRLFLSAEGIFGSRNDSYFDGGYALGQYRVNTLGAGLAGGLNLGKDAQLRGGFFARRYETEIRSGTISHPDVADVAAGPTAGFSIDRLDDPAIPKSGFLVQGTLESSRLWAGADADYDRLWGHWAGAGTWGRTTFLGLAQGGTDLGSGLPHYRQFFLGGMRGLAGYQRSHLRGDAVAAGALGILHRFGGGDLPFSSRYYLALWAEAGNAWDRATDFGFDDLVYGGAISLIMDSPLGPLEMGYGMVEGGKYAFHLEFGFQLSSPIN